ncbi:citryl-CoA lyase [Patescibacteria group bacterium]|nr:citryl-CoA lyase [Patescibacteria group bacterium]MBU1722200.1 citryl-CoA lyase [Patescibacteria group bacterium]MBU1901151.1 citryl-CoA lyase [Patescibacteria group bacterium]
MKIKTAITDIKENKEYIRGEALSSLIQDKSFVEVIYLLLRGELPSSAHKEMMNALFVAAIDHGPGTASAQTARIVASAKNSMHTALAAGILAMGERHGSAIEGAAQFFVDHKDEENIAGIVADLKAKKVRIPGFGHPFLSHDERSDVLFVKAEELGITGVHCRVAKDVHTALNAISSKPLALNIDGSMAAILSDMGFDSAMMKGLFIIARMPGLVGQVYEEQTNDVGIRRMSQDHIEYVGK